MAIIKVHAFDPGITTGYATGIIEKGEMGVVSGQMRWKEFELYAELKQSDPDIIIYERFDYRNNRHKYRADNVELFPRNLIGIIEMYKGERQSVNAPVTVYAQTPAQGKGHFNDTLLKKHNVYKVANPHANDAMRHLLTWWLFGAGYQYNGSKSGGFKPLA